MQVTKVSVRLAPETIEHASTGYHLADRRGIIAYCEVNLDDCFTIKEVRVIGEIDGMKVSMPDRKLTIRFACGHKNQFDANFCSNCGKPKTADDVPRIGERRFLDMCHPTTPEFRRHLNERVIVAIKQTLDETLVQLKDQPKTPPASQSSSPS